MAHKPPCRGGPLCPPARFGTKPAFIDTSGALAGWMPRIHADLADGHANICRYKPSHIIPRRGGPLCPPARIGVIKANVDANDAPAMAIVALLRILVGLCTRAPTTTWSLHSSRYKRLPQRGRRCTNRPLRKLQVIFLSETHPRQVQQLVWRSASGE